MTVQEAIENGDVTREDIDQALFGSGDDAQTNSSDDTVLDSDQYDGIDRMIKSESEQLERHLLMVIDAMERRLEKRIAAIELYQESRRVF